MAAWLRVVTGLTICMALSGRALSTIYVYPAGAPYTTYSGQALGSTDSLLVSGVYTGNIPSAASGAVVIISASGGIEGSTNATATGSAIYYTSLYGSFSSNLYALSGGCNLTLGVSPSNEDVSLTFQTTAIDTTGTITIYGYLYGNVDITRSGPTTLANGFIEMGNFLTFTSNGTLTISGGSFRDANANGGSVLNIGAGTDFYMISGGTGNTGASTNNGSIYMTGGTITEADWTNNDYIQIAGGDFDSVLSNNGQVDLGQSGASDSGEITKTVTNNASSTFNYYSGSFSNINNSGSFSVYGNLTLNSSNFTTVAGSITVVENTLTLSSFANTTPLTVDAGAGLILAGNLSGNATITSAGSITISDTIANANSITLDSASTNTTSFTLSSNVTLTQSAAFTIGSFDTVSVPNTTTLDLASTLTNNGNINVDGLLVVADGGTNAGTITINSDGSMTATDSTTLTNSGTIINNNSLKINGPLTNSNILTNNSNLTVSATLDNTGTFTNSGTATFTAALDGSGTTILAANGSMTFNSNGSITGQTFDVYSNGQIYVNGTGAINNAINGESNNTGTLLEFGATTGGTFSLSNAVTDIQSISVQGDSTLSASAAITGVGTGLYVGSGSTATFTNTLSGGSSAQIYNSGTINLNSGSVISDFATINMYSDSLLDLNNGGTLNVTNIMGSSGNTGSVLEVGSSANTLAQVAGTIQDIRLINIYSGSTLELQSGAQILSTTDSNDIIINGTLQIDDGSFLTIDQSDTITGNGNIINSGILTLNSSNLTLGGDFDNTGTGVFAINGTPTITFNGGSFISAGEINATFSSSNSLPFIDVPNASTVNLSAGTVVIGYQQDYIAGKNYILLTAGSTIPTLGSYFTPPASFYITSMSLAVDGNSIVVTVVRDGFGHHALTETAQEIGDFLETIGAGTPTQAELNLLNALEKITNDYELTIALESLIPPSYVSQINLQIQDALMGSIFLRLASQRLISDYGSLANFGYAYGDEDPENAVWIRPFYESAKQRTNGNQVAYTATTHGVVLGLDREITANLMLGFAFNYANSNATNTDNIGTKTNIKNYQGTAYGTYKSDHTTYFDALISVGVNNCTGTRSIDLPGFNENAYSKYQTQQFTTKARFSKDYKLTNYVQFSPEASAQYSFVRQPPYTENGAGPYDIYTDPDNTNLFRLGAGAKFALPMSSGKMLSIPSAYVIAFVDAAGGGQDNNSQFIVGGPVITNTIQPNRLMLTLGLEYEFSLADNLQIIANYNLDLRRSFTGQEAFLNIRYLF